MKHDVYLLCESCNKAYIASSEDVGNKRLACMCNQELKKVDKDTAMRVFLENRDGKNKN